MIDNRVIMIRGNKSEWYDQAIFILKKDAGLGAMPGSIVMEAEKIINNYMAQHTRKLKTVAKEEAIPLPRPAQKYQNEVKKRKQESTFSRMILQISLILCSVAFGIVLYKIVTFQ